MFVSTGIVGIDNVISGLRLGDNVVWQLDSIDDYQSLVIPFVKASRDDNKRIVYIRFGNHEPLLKEKEVSNIYNVDAGSGFEPFSFAIHQIIENEGEGVYYVFDCLSDLLSAWSNDLMTGNFFKITCPYLFELDTVAYFSLLRYSHSFKTLARIRDTTQVLIDVFHNEDNYYIHPLKALNRYSPKMFLPHIKQEDVFVPITSSFDSARLFSNAFEKQTTRRKLDNWDKVFLKAEDVAEQKEIDPEVKNQLFDQTARLILSKDEKILAMIKKTMSLEDILNIKARMIGTGYVGGKTVGMLLARSIVSRREPAAEQWLEPHDSFYVGSDVFYTYIVENGWWNEWMKQREKNSFTEARALHEKMLTGKFPEEIKEQFKILLTYFGESPIIVRSSSLLEDSFGNIFAGKYESVFLANQGSPEERFKKFTDACRIVFASTMNREALVYLSKRGLKALDEQMALLVQRVSGSLRNQYFFPDLAGVGISYNAFIWKGDLDPKAGMLRLVYGMGTRAVNRVEGDYPRIVALDAPLLKAHAGIAESKQFSQHAVDVINITKNAFETVQLNELLSNENNLPIDLIAVKDDEATELLHQYGKSYDAWVLTFDKLFLQTDLSEKMRRIMRQLEEAYGFPIDIEFTLNFNKDAGFQLNLLQCRPMVIRGISNKAPSIGLSKEHVLFRSKGNFMGGNVSLFIDRIIYVDPKAYNSITSQSGKYDIARAIGEINDSIGDKADMTAMLLGPGRWGTSTPSLGVPVSFAEINNISVLGEIAFADNNIMPELSYGSHFFQDLIENDIFYLALFPDSPETEIDRRFFDESESILGRDFPGLAKYSDIIKLFDVRKKKTHLIADIITQDLLCFETEIRQQ
jgi:hypothetical protein